MKRPNSPLAIPALCLALWGCAPSVPQPTVVTGGDIAIVKAIQAKINGNWVMLKDDQLATRKPIVVDLDLTPAGDLSKIAIVRSSGSPALDFSLERAIRKSIPLPIPHDRYDRFKRIELVFVPAQFEEGRK